MKMKRSISLLLSGLMLFSVACSGGKDPSSSDPNENNSQVQLKESDYYLVKDGKSDYQIVFSPNATYYESFAVSELQTFFYEATGISLPAVYDTQVETFDESTRYIFVGPTEQMSEAGITLKYEEVEETGYKLVNKGPNLFLVGGSFATPSAVYDFLDYQFGYEAYMYDEVYIGKAVGDVKMYEYDIFKKPHFLTIGGYGEVVDSRDVATRMGLMRMFDLFLPVESTNKGQFHNFVGVVNQHTYNKANYCWVEQEHECVNDFKAGTLNRSNYPECQYDYVTCVENHVTEEDKQNCINRSNNPNKKMEDYPNCRASADCQLDEPHGCINLSTDPKSDIADYVDCKSSINYCTRQDEHDCVNDPNAERKQIKNYPDCKVDPVACVVKHTTDAEKKACINLCTDINKKMEDFPNCRASANHCVVKTPHECVNNSNEIANYPDCEHDSNYCVIETEHDCINDSTDVNKDINDYPDCKSIDNVCMVEGAHGCVNHFDKSATIERFPDCEATHYHPEWFSNEQLNLSIAIEEMTNVVVENWKETLAESESIGTGQEITWSFTAMDTRTWSTAESSTALYDKYKSYAAEYIRFVNVAAEKMNAWMADNAPDRHIRYVIFAYQATVYPPNALGSDGKAIKDENGNYMAADDTVLLADNVTLMYAPLGGSFYYSFEDENNQEWDDVLDRWMPICGDNEVFYWLYFCNFENRLVPLDFSHSLQTNMIWAYEHKGELMMFEVDAYNNKAPNWASLHMYLMSNLGKDVYQDIGTLKKDFFANVYKDAQEPMEQFYEEFSAHFAYLAETTNLTFNYVTESAIMEKANWDYGMLTQWLGYIDEAYARIEHYKTENPGLYTKLHDRINLETITIRYLMLELYGTRLDDKKAYATELLNDCLHLGVTNHSGTKVSDYFKKYFN